MDVLLSSFVLDAAALRRAGLPPPVTGRAGRAGIVLNALDQYGGTRDRDLGREVATFAACGYRGEELDLRAYAGRPAPELAARLAGLDLVWALGGNAFVLARAMDAAGFGAAVRQQTGRAEFVYGGYSAGACVAGPDLRGIHLMDESDVVPDGYPSTARPRTLALVPYRIVPHWRSPHPEAASAERAAAWLTARQLAHRCLRDGEVVRETVTGSREQDGNGNGRLGAKRT